MRLFYAELHKLFSKRVFVSCLVLFLAANAVILTYTQSNDYMTKIIHDNQQLYNDMIDDCKGKTASDALEYLDLYKTANSIRSSLDRIKTETDPMILEIETQMLEQKIAESPEAYKIALNIDDDNEKMMYFSPLLDDLKEQCNSHLSFTRSIEEMEQRAEQQSFLSIFAKDGEFAKANTKKTLADFQNMKGREVTIGSNAAVTAATKFAITDYFVFALVFAACIFLFTTERDKNLYCLIRSTKQGRLPLIAAKITALGTVTVCVSAIYYISTIAAAAYYTSLGDTTRTVQSVPVFHNCNLRLTIGEYLVVWVLSKTAAMLAVAMLLALIFTLIKSTPTVALVCALLFGSEFIMYTAIDRNSYVNHLKYINIFCLVNGNNVFGDYLNLNIFTVPVNMMTIYSVLVPLMMIISAAVTSIMFVKHSQFAKAAVWDKALDKLRAKFLRKQGSVSVFAGESFKHYKGSLVWIVIVLLAYYGYTSLCSDLTFYCSDPGEALYREYMITLEGELTAEKEQFIADEQQSIDDAFAEIAEISADESIEEYQKASMLHTLTQSAEIRQKGFAKILEQYDYIKSTGQQRGLAPAFVDVLVYKRLLQNPVKEWRFFAMLILAVIFCSSNIFAYEYKRDMVNLIRCTKRGKMHLVITKLSVALLTSIISYTLIYLPYMINFVRTFGSASLSAPLIFIPDFAAVDSNITTMQYLCLIGAVHILFAFSAAIFVSMLSLVVRNNTTVMIVSAVLLLVPFAVFYRTESVRSFSVFMSGKQTVVMSAVIGGCVAIGAISFFIIIKVFFPLRRSKHA